MGFDWNLEITTYIDPATGLPIVWHPSELRKIPYVPELWRLPDDFRRFAVMRGQHLHAYTNKIEESENRYSCDANTFLALFPTWQRVKAYLGDEYDYWSEEDHMQFLKCIKWCASKGGYSMSWSW